MAPAGVPQVSDDEVFRRKLQMDGEGQGDDRKLLILYKSFLKWCLTKEETEEERQLSCKRLMYAISGLQLTNSKSQVTQEMNESEIKNYDLSYEHIEAGIQDTQQKIIQIKADLQQSKRTRKNKQQYDAMAKIISREPDRKMTLKKLKDINDDIKVLERKKAKLMEKLERQKRHFYVLLCSSFELKQSLRDDSSESEADVEKMDVS